MGRYFIIGDIHGEYDTLSKFLEEGIINFEEDTVIFVGDYFDRGQKSYEVFLELSTLKSKMGDRCILIRGNHEQMLLDYMDRTDFNWVRNGYKPTIRSFLKNNIPLKQVYDWIKDFTVLFFDCEQFSVVHAGRYHDNLSEDELDTLIWDRNSLYTWDGKLTFVGHSLHQVAHSKDAVYWEGENYALPKSGMIDIDTGLVFGNGLTVAEINGDSMKFYFTEHFNK